MKKLSFCLWCGKKPKRKNDSNHSLCRDKLKRFFKDLEKVSAKDKWKIFWLAEQGFYGTDQGGKL